MSWELIHDDCLEHLKTMNPNSVDSAIFSPPYPGIKRKYGTWKPQEWLIWMNEVMEAVKRVLKPKGSALVVIQPNYEKVGKRNTWAWEFALNMAKQWNIVQDAYWIKKSVIPSVGATKHGLMRNAVEWCLWIGEPDCYRNQKAVLKPYSDDMLKVIAGSRKHEGRPIRPSGRSFNYATAKDNGGATPFNYVTVAPQGYNKHPACFPLKLAEFWAKYLTPPQGTILDPFAGSATTGVAALKYGFNFIGIEKFAEYIEPAKQRLQERIRLESC